MIRALGVKGGASQIGGRHESHDENEKGDDGQQAVNFVYEGRL